VFIKIGAKTRYLWRAVDQHGNVLDILVTSRRDAQAATRFLRKLLTRQQCVPRVLVTDKLASYGVAHRRLMPSVEHRRSKYLNNKAENSHQPTRQRETSDETIPLRRWRPTFPVLLQWHITALPTPPPPTHRSPVPTRNDHPIHHLERDRRHPHRMTQVTV
jgi:IS1 family transposase